MGNDPADQPDLLGPFGIDAVAGQQELHGVLPVDALRQPDGAHDGRNSYAHFRIRELGPVAGDHEVAPRHQRQSVPEAVPVDRSDDRLEDLPPALERVDGRLLPERARELTDRARAVAQITAGRERAARARDDRDPRVLVVAEASERVVEAAPHHAVHRVERLGAVVGDGGHVAVELVEHRVAHRSPFWKRRLTQGTTGRGRTPPPRSW